MENKQQIEIDVLNKITKTIKNTNFQFKPGTMGPRDLDMWHAGLGVALLIIETAKNLIEEEED